MNPKKRSSGLLRVSHKRILRGPSALIPCLSGGEHLAAVIPIAQPF
jgi:hypothetical protein